MTTPFGSDLLLGASLGTGATGRVVQGTIRSTGEQVAVKLLREELASDPIVVGRFLQEARLLSSLQHPSLVGLRDVVMEAGQLGIVMELVPGGDLRRRLLEGGRLSPAAACAVLAPVADALAVVHAAGITHRDLKPENVLLDAAGAPKLADLGVSRLTSGAAMTTQTGLIGTPNYLAPEAVEGQPGPPADVYALGVMLHELLAGEPPFGTGHPVAVLRRHLEEAAPVLPVVPALADLLDQMMAKDPAARPSAAAASAELSSLAAALVAEPVVAVVPSYAPRPAADGSDPGATGVRPRPVVPAAVVEQEQSRRGLVLVAAGTAAVLALAGGAFVLFPRHTRPATAASRPTLVVTASDGSRTAVPAKVDARGRVTPASPLPVGTTVLPPAQQPVYAQLPGTSYAGSPAYGGPVTTGSGTVSAPVAPAPAVTSRPAATRSPTPAPTAAPSAAPAVTRAPSPTPSPAAAAPSTPPPVPGGLPANETDRHCSAKDDWAFSTAAVGTVHVQTVACIGHSTFQGSKVEEVDVYVREVPGKNHRTYGRFTVLAQLRRASTPSATPAKSTECDVTAVFNQPSSDRYWARCTFKANTGHLYPDYVAWGAARMSVDGHRYMGDTQGHIAKSPKVG